LPYDYANENDIETFFKKHADIIFGNFSLFFDGTKIKSNSNIGSIPDGFVVILDEEKWYIIEVELSIHPLHDHIVPQISRFNSALRNYETKKKLIDTFYNVIQNDNLLRSKFDSMGIQKELYKVLTEIIHKNPEILIVIDEGTDELKEICDSLPFLSKVIEFKTYYREILGEREYVCHFDLQKEDKDTKVDPSEISGLNKSKADLAYEILKRSGNPMHTEDIWKRMVEKGKKTTGKTPINTLYSDMYKDNRFKRVDKGIWTLKDGKLSAEMPTSEEITTNSKVKEISSSIDDEPIPATISGSDSRKMKLKGEPFDIRNSYDIIVNTANWLIKNGKLKPSDCPLTIGRGKNYLINREPKHRDESDFLAPKKLSNGLWIMANNSDAGHIKYAKRLLEKCGEKAEALTVDAKQG
jgi:DNA-directed RNA polymerase delta subunit